MTPVDAPLVLTLALDKPSFQFFNRLRQAHFPAERNFLEAHLSLFHHLPGTEAPCIADHLAQVCRAQPPLTLPVTEVKMIGKGVAYVVKNKALVAWREQLAHHWQAWLTPQDRQKLWPHITVQNKVTPAEARALQQQLAQDFAPFQAQGTGVCLWAYRNGPWEWLHDFGFEG
ncbi:2'-5' RNA ligase superfamily protein [Catalinimonas alkaloidigena]|uniref:2'-5' RNA ligase superfamily protein n=1 Tax=Catalinimonas alkaloidigena TaxID=1075417 RepID=A0A1G9QDK1_9BACT|nr:2'-5' RNA ligase family protein [Catalinimonas alkaloidigena]SDM08801.1 2'-5' RNA ligase superfamily protein [Catalinimonas alkaloidigena]